MEVPQPRTALETKLEGLFEKFVAMGEKRSYGKLARANEVEGTQLMRHARKFLWAERYQNLLVKHNEQTAVDPATRGDDLDAADINRLHLTRLVALQKKAMSYLEDVVFDKPETALKTLIDSMKLQREIKGMTKNKEDDLRSVLLERLRESQEGVDSPDNDENEFVYDPDFQVEPLTDDNQTDPAPPDGGGHVE